ncbi:MAG: hypothetical protein AB8W37_09640 [Arsenophonus endosymbiont of Dermacentor nuttalli]
MAIAELEIQTKILTDLVSVFKLPQDGSDDLNYRPREKPAKFTPQQEVIDDKKIVKNDDNWIAF